MLRQQAHDNISEEEQEKFSELEDVNDDVSEDDEDSLVLCTLGGKV